MFFIKLKKNMFYYVFLNLQMNVFNIYGINMSAVV